MSILRSVLLWTLTCLSLSVFTATAGEPPDFWRASGNQAAVVAGTKEAADAAIDVLHRGNAADAAVTALLVLSVTDPNNFCLGGEVPVLVYDAKRKTVEVICGQGAAPRLATVEWFEKHKGGRIPGANDPTTAAVPGALDACLTALDRYGTLTFSEAAGPMLKVLDRQDSGWKADLAKTVRRLMEAEKAAEGDRRRGLRLVADCFYRGPIARELDAWSRQHGGLLRYTDLATHATRIEEPVSAPYRSHTVLKCGPWTQGPFLLQTMALVENLELKKMGHNRPDYVHTVVEAMKLALADRDTYYADPLFVDVPLRELLSPQYASLRRPLIDMAHASAELRPGDPLTGRALLGKTPQAYRVPEQQVRDTTTCLVADKEGNVVAATPSGWAGVLAGRTGVVLGSRLRSLNTWRGHPNCIEPGKRPRITLTPTLVMRDGKPVATISVAGGDQQDQVTLQLLLSHVEFGLAPADAVTAPRFITEHHVGSFNQTLPQLASLLVYESFGKDTIDALAARGHRVLVKKPPFGHPTMLTIGPDAKKQAAGDPKAGRHARAY
jgi:gamma-glutamyltranspeptidase/glutathione hydrolase